MQKSHVVILQGVKQLNSGDKTVYHLTFVDEDEVGVSVASALTLDGYTLDEDEDGALDEADTLLEALNKVEARLVALEA